MDVDDIIPYVPNTYPAIAGGEALYLVEELQKLQDTFTKLIEVLTALETRIETLEP